MGGPRVEDMRRAASAPWWQPAIFAALLSLAAFAWTWMAETEALMATQAVRIERLERDVALLLGRTEERYTASDARRDRAVLLEKLEREIRLLQDGQARLGERVRAVEGDGRTRR